METELELVTASAERLTGSKHPYLLGGIALAERYHLVFLEGAAAALLAPPPVKAVAANSSRLASGRQVVDTPPRLDSREFTLPCAIVAPKGETAGERMTAMYSDLHALGVAPLWVYFNPHVVYNVRLVSCTNVTALTDEIAVFQLRFEEPDPSARAWCEGVAALERIMPNLESE